MKGAFSLNNPLVGTVRPPERIGPPMRLNSLNRDMFKPFRSHNGLLG